MRKSVFLLGMAIIISVVLVISYLSLRIPYQLYRLNSTDPLVRQKAAMALIGQLSPEHFDEVVKLINDNFDSVRRQVPWLLAKCDPVKARFPLSKMLFDRDGGIRYNASWALAYCYGFDADDDLRVIRNLIRAFREYKQENALFLNHISMTLEIISGKKEFHLTNDDDLDEKLQLYLKWFYQETIKLPLPDVPASDLSRPKRDSGDGKGKK